MKFILLVKLLHGSSMFGRNANFGRCSIIYSTDIGFEVSSVALYFSLVNLRVVNLLERTETGLITRSDKTVRAVHSCNTG